MKIFAACALFCLAPSSPGPGAPPATVSPNVETEPAPDAEDAAGDAAIWVNRTDPASSRVIGTSGKGGLTVYDLDGGRAQSLPVGGVTHVDLRPGFTLGGRTVALVAGTRPDQRSIQFWTIRESDPRLVAAPGEGVRVSVDGPNGLTMFRSGKDGRIYCFVSDAKGVVEQWRIDESGGVIGATCVRTLRLSGRVEGMCADDDAGWLYLGEEAKGIWRVGAEPDAAPTPIAVDLAEPRGRLTPGIRGLAMRPGPGKSGYLIASQGGGAFMVYDRAPPNAFRGTFRVGRSGSVDAVAGTRGIESTSESLGARFPRGLLVVQDDDNEGLSQNFKFVPWENVTGALRLDR